MDWFIIAGIVWISGFLILVRILLYRDFKKELLKGQFVGTFDQYKVKKRWSFNPWEKGKPTLLSRYHLSPHGTIISVGYAILGLVLIANISIK